MSRLLELSQLLQSLEDDSLARLLHLAGEVDLVEDGEDLVEVEDEVELAHGCEELVEQLHEEVDRLQIHQLVVVHVKTEREVQAGITTVHDLEATELRGISHILKRYRDVISPSEHVSECPAQPSCAAFRSYLDEVGELRVALRDQLVHLGLELALLLMLEAGVVLGCGAGGGEHRDGGAEDR